MHCCMSVWKTSDQIAHGVRRRAKVLRASGNTSNVVSSGSRPRARSPADPAPAWYGSAVIAAFANLARDCGIGVRHDKQYAQTENTDRPSDHCLSMLHTMPIWAMGATRNRGRPRPRRPAQTSTDGAGVSAYVAASPTKGRSLSSGARNATSPPMPGSAAWPSRGAERRQRSFAGQVKLGREDARIKGHRKPGGQKRVGRAGPQTGCGNCDGALESCVSK
jgi:hypothetical protein